ncbi:hypothetical protein SYNPS1DRAFT_26088 [Syncephalis pseudoplumigaleata]|uniref:Uncharacterized protein n=1 Tax=Syncephalis pseudoplumigaleata TaxID=1712513 RepID=A0A4P9YR08_9FUNG|nr:hypothetical protein SYNPS1DRAFT_26088 [Syncephalis pseudoplumigaleata]|eukprot:RKP22247.1 hypothetical protein SYNPS1DRAFT_26088 [Syncephalis pseudoplumigaleata]
MLDTTLLADLIDFLFGMIEGRIDGQIELVMLLAAPIAAAVAVVVITFGRSHGMQEEQQRERVELFIVHFTLQMITIMSRVVTDQLAANTPDAAAAASSSSSDAPPSKCESINELTDRVPPSVRRILPCMRVSVNWLRTTFDRLPHSAAAQRATTLQALADMLNAFVVLGVDATLEIPDDAILPEDILMRGAAYLNQEVGANMHAYSDESLALASVNKR